MHNNGAMNVEEGGRGCKKNMQATPKNSSFPGYNVFLKGLVSQGSRANFHNSCLSGIVGWKRVDASTAKKSLLLFPSATLFVWCHRFYFEKSSSSRNVYSPKRGFFHGSSRRRHKFFHHLLYCQRQKRESCLSSFFGRQHFSSLHIWYKCISGSSSRRRRIVIIREKLGLFKCSNAQIARFRFSRSRVLVPRCTYCTLRGRNFCICLHKC